MRESNHQHYEEIKNDIAGLKAKDDVIKSLSQREGELKEEINL